MPDAMVAGNKALWNKILKNCVCVVCVSHICVAWCLRHINETRRHDADVMADKIAPFVLWDYGRPDRVPSTPPSCCTYSPDTGTVPASISYR